MLVFLILRVFLKIVVGYLCIVLLNPIINKNFFKGKDFRIPHISLCPSIVFDYCLSSCFSLLNLIEAFISDYFKLSGQWKENFQKFSFSPKLQINSFTKYLSLRLK